MLRDEMSPPSLPLAFQHCSLLRCQCRRQLVSMLLLVLLVSMLLLLVLLSLLY
jgi:hypothetical protein